MAFIKTMVKKKTQQLQKKTGLPLLTTRPRLSQGLQASGSCQNLQVVLIAFIEMTLPLHRVFHSSHTLIVK